MNISLIVAISENNVIGRDNDLPWHIPEDLKRFKEITKGHPVIMGRKTHESIGRLLPNRTNIIITRDTDYKVEGAIVVYSLDEAIEEAKNVIASKTKQSQDSGQARMTEITHGKQSTKNYDESSSPQPSPEKERETKDEVFIIGGGQIFKQAMEIADKLYLTVVHTEIEGDVYFPDYSVFNKEVYRRKSSSEKYSYTFFDLEKK